MNARALPYKLRWATRPGVHRGAGGASNGFAPFVRASDPRRLDVRMNLRDPFDNLHVRELEQKCAVSVYALVDVSGSMSFEGSARKMELAAQLCATLAASARAAGDAFGLIGCDDEIREDLLLPATRLRGVEQEVFQRLLRFQPEARSSRGLLEAARYFTGRRKFVFVVSDFLMPLADVEATLQSLARHDVAPIVIRDPVQDSQTPRWGFTRACDIETGQKRLVFMRPKLREAWLRKAEERHRQILRLCERYGRRPFVVDGRFDARAFGAYLMEG